MTQFSPKTLLIAVCFMSFSLSQAQEFIEEPIHAKKYSSIIREISKEECSFFGKENMEFTPRLEISNPRILPTPEPRENNEGIIKNICK